jgi:hypothetical protein
MQAKKRKVNRTTQTGKIAMPTIRRERTIVGVKIETEAIDAALNLVVFRAATFKSLEKVAGKGGLVNDCLLASSALARRDGVGQEPG